MKRKFLSLILVASIFTTGSVAAYVTPNIVKALSDHHAPAAPTKMTLKQALGGTSSYTITHRYAVKPTGLQILKSIAAQINDSTKIHTNQITVGTVGNGTVTISVASFSPDYDLTTDNTATINFTYGPVSKSMVTDISAVETTIGNMPATDPKTWTEQELLAVVKKDNPQLNVNQLTIDKNTSNCYGGIWNFQLRTRTDSNYYTPYSAGDATTFKNFKLRYKVAISSLITTVFNVHDIVWDDMSTINTAIKNANTTTMQEVINTSYATIVRTWNTSYKRIVITPTATSIYLPTAMTLVPTTNFTYDFASIPLDNVDGTTGANFSWGNVDGRRTLISWVQSTALKNQINTYDLYDTLSIPNTQSSATLRDIRAYAFGRPNTGTNNLLPTKITKLNMENANGLWNFWEGAFRDATFSDIYWPTNGIDIGYVAWASFALNTTQNFFHNAGIGKLRIKCYSEDWAWARCNGGTNAKQSDFVLTLYNYNRNSGSEPHASPDFGENAFNGSGRFCIIRATDAGATSWPYWNSNVWNGCTQISAVTTVFYTNGDSNVSGWSNITKLNSGKISTASGPT